MRVCPSCGRENPDGFVLCGYCGASLAAPVVERRKLATLVFCDMSGSTAMGERVDAETVRSLMLSYFHEMRGALERHGGTVEKFVGDAVLAVFGVPETHEDDALRACRAALEMQARLGSLNQEFERRYATTIALRIGVNTGEVVAGDPASRETFVTGDAVNVAARLEQAAAPGEVLIGDPTLRLVRDAVTVEAVEPLSAKGKSEPVAAYRLLEASGMGPVPRRAGAALVGRGDELGTLEREFESVVAERSCRLVTVVGEPGVGKSRLAAELVDRIGARARVARGACLSYGEGITYWPVGQVVRELAGIHDEHSADEARARIDGLLEGVPQGSVIAAKTAQLLGVAEGISTPPETIWAIRHLLEAQAATQPLLLIVDDIHWAEQALLDLLGALPAMIADARILVLCLARPELLEARSGWPATVRLEPLGADDVDALLESLLGDAPAVVRGRLAQASGGNPLFAEELVAMLLDEGVLRIEDGHCTVVGDLDAVALPASLHALLGARLDLLDRDARDALERGSIEGEVFHRGGVVELSAPEARPTVPERLEDLAGKDIVRPAAASFVGEAAFRFKHILFRDAAYRATAKKLRASLHEQFAYWLERFAGERVAEYEEILGYHLEQSHRYHMELGPPTAEILTLGRRGAARLASAGRRAFARGDVPAAINLLQRASALVPAPSRERIQLVPSLAEALFFGGRVEEADALVNEASEAAELLGDEHLIALVSVGRAPIKLANGTQDWLTRAPADAERAIPVLERHGDDIALALAWEVIATAQWAVGHLSQSHEAAGRGLFHAERGDDMQRQAQLRRQRVASAFFGSVPFDEVERVLEDELAWTRRTGTLWLEAVHTQALGLVHAVRGDTERGTELVARGRATLTDLGQVLFEAGVIGAWIWWLTDDPVAAEERLRTSCEVFASAGIDDSTIVGNLAEALYRQGRYAEAEEVIDRAAELTADGDVLSQSLVRATRAKLLARRGLTADAEELAREAVALAADREFVDRRAESLLALGEVLRLSGHEDEAVAAARQAHDIWEAKGNVRAAARAMALVVP